MGGGDGSSRDLGNRPGRSTCQVQPCPDHHEVSWGCRAKCELTFPLTILGGGTNHQGKDG